MTRARPYPDTDSLFAAASKMWNDLAPGDWRQSFAAHPRIGGAVRQAPHGGDPRWATKEQSGMTEANDELRAQLARTNEQYEQKFGHTFIVCATGLSAEETLARMRERMENDPAAEIRTAATEEEKITRLRLEKLLTELAEENR